MNTKTGQSSIVLFWYFLCLIFDLAVVKVLIFPI